MVKGSHDKLYAVTLFPKETCQCPSTGSCYHIVAARNSINMPDDNKNKIRNLSQILKKSRSKPDKKSCRKKPRIGDLDCSTVTVPVRDSIWANITEKNMENHDLTSHPDLVEYIPKQPVRTPKSILKRKQV